MVVVMARRGEKKISDTPAYVRPRVQLTARERSRPGSRQGVLFDTIRSRSTIGGGGYHQFVPVLGRDGTKKAPPGDFIDQPSREMS